MTETKEEKLSFIKSVAQEVFYAGVKLRDVVECYGTNRVPVFNVATGELKIIDKETIAELGKSIPDDMVEARQLSEIKKVVAWYRKLDDKICDAFEEKFSKNVDPDVV